MGPCGLMDKAPDFGSGDCRFESCQGRPQSFTFRELPWARCMSCSWCDRQGMFHHCCTSRAGTAGCQGAGILLTNKIVR